MNITRLKEIKLMCKELVAIRTFELCLFSYRTLVNQTLKHGGPNHMALQDLQEYRDTVVKQTYMEEGNIKVEKNFLVGLVSVIDEICDLEL